MLEVPFFNIHDIILITVIFECILMSSILAWTHKGKRISNLLLASFLLCIAAYSIDTITYWNVDINDYASKVSTNLFFILGFSALLKGPFIYWYTKSFIYRNFRLHHRDLIHLIPALAYPFYMYFIYYQHDETYKLAIIDSYDVLIANTWFKLLRWFQDFSVIFYGLYSVYLLIKNKKQLADTYANFTSKEYNWLQLLLFGFLFIWFWVFLSYLQVWLTDWTIPIGTMGNYLTFFLVNALLLYGLGGSNIFYEVPPQYAIDDTGVVPEVEYQHVDLLKRKMEKDKLFTRSNLTLERLAEELGIPTKALSKTINGHFQKNFFEFISYYRVEEAKRLLREEPTMSIQDVMLNSGFRSKSAFNRFFLKYASEPPSAYRKKHALI